MTRDARHVEDAELLDALASVVEQIRAQSYADVANDVQTVLRTKADGFIDRLADHLRHEESHLFPELKQVSPSCAGEIDGLIREHGRMRGLAREFSVAVVEGRHQRALEVSREFLAELLAHMEQEDQLVTRILMSLSPKEARALRAVVGESQKGHDEGGILRA